jgi:serine/threonine-protein kinase RsbW
MSVRPSPSHILPECFVIPSEACEAMRIKEMVSQKLREKGYIEKDIIDIHQALEEALVNAIKHGNGCDCRKQLRISFCIDDDCFQVCIEDEGEGFDPQAVPNPIAFENLETPCGRGLLMMRHYMSEVSYLEPGNAVMMIKKRCGCEAT